MDTNPTIPSNDSEILKLLKENNALLHSLVRREKQRRALRIVYWLIIIVLTIISIRMITPYFQGLMDAYSGLGDLSSGSESGQYQDLLKSLEEQQ